MARVKNTKVTRARRKKVLKLAKGYFGSKRTLYRTANEQVMRSLRYQYRDRRQRRRQFRKLWITRINAGCQLNGIKYSRFIHGLNLLDIKVNRKMLSDLAINDPKVFAELCVKAQKAIDSGKQLKEEKPVYHKVIKASNENVGGKKKTTKKEQPKKEEKVVAKKEAVKKETPKAEPKKETKTTTVKKETVKVSKEPARKSVVKDLGEDETLEVKEMKKANPAPHEKNTLEREELRKQTVAKLRELANGLGLVGHSKLNKEELIDLILKKRK